MKCTKCGRWFERHAFTYTHRFGGMLPDGLTPSCPFCFSPIYDKEAYDKSQLGENNDK